jgi:hypothetical protein
VKAALVALDRRGSACWDGRCESAPARSKDKFGGRGGDGLTDATLARRIAELIRAFQAGGAPHDWQQELACRFDALPVYGDLGGALLLRPDAEVLAVAWDSESVAHVAEPRERILGLAVAADEFPELRPLLPRRPETAVSCPACGGGGRWKVPWLEPGPWCGHCMGVGWLDEKPAEPRRCT